MLNNQIVFCLALYFKMTMTQFGAEIDFFSVYLLFLDFG